MVTFGQLRDVGAPTTPELICFAPNVGEPKRPEVFESGAGWAEGARTPSEFPPPPAERERFKKGVLLGRGSMGRVHELVDRRLQRSIAKKELGTNTGDMAMVAARLEREATITAQLEHPGIVPVYDSGADDFGRPWYTMRLVRGRSLAQALHDAKDPRERLLLTRRMVDVAQTVAFAHGKGVVHRDLKPDNVMLGEYGETLVMDWGLARRLDESVLDDPAISGLPVPPILTGVGDVVGTPAYMSPEQAFGEQASTRADVWSIGAMLYELLTGHRLIALDDPNAALAALRAGRVQADDLPTLAAGSPPELVAIAMRALRADPEERYQDARELAADLADFYDGNLVGAYAYTPLQHLQRYLEANRRVVAVIGASIFALVLIVTFSVIRVDGERRRALEAEDTTQEALALANARLGRVLSRVALESVRSGELPEAAVLAAQSLERRENPAARGVLMASTGASLPRLIARRVLPEGCLHSIATSGGQLCLGRSALARYQGGRRLWLQELDAPTEFVRVTQDGVDSIVTLSDHGERLRWFAVADGEPGRELVLSSPIEGIRGAGAALWARRGAGIWRSWDGTELGLIEPKEGAMITAVAAAPDGELLAFADDEALHYGPLAGPFRRVEFDRSRAHGSRVAASRGSADVQGLSWVDGESIVVGLRDGSLRRVLTTDGKTLWEAVAQGGMIDALSESEGVVVVRTERGGLELWDASHGTYLSRLPEVAGRDFSFVAGGVESASASERWRWSLATLAPRRYLATGSVRCARLSPDGEHLVVLHRPRHLSVYELGNGRLLARRAWQKLELLHADFTPDGSRLFVIAQGGREIDVFETEGWTRLESRPWPLDQEEPRALGFFASGQLLALSSGGHAVLYDTEGTPHPTSAEIYGSDLSFAPDRRAAWVLGDRGQIYEVRDPAAGDEDPSARPLFRVPGARAVAYADADTLAVGLSDRVQLHSLHGGELLASTPPAPSRLLDVAVSEDGAFVASGSLDGRVRVHDREGGLVASIAMQEARISHVSFARDRLWTSSGDGSVQPWSLAPLRDDVASLQEAIERRWGLRFVDLTGRLDVDDQAP